MKSRALGRRAGIAAATVVSLTALAGLADAACAMRAESAIAERSRTASALEDSPAVYIGGFPFLAALVTHEVPFLEVNALDVEVPTYGMVNASTTLRDITVDRQQLLTGNFEGAKVSTFSRSISLDGVAVGRLLGMNDLLIANPKNISPSGGTSAEAELTGTIPGEEEPTTVTVELRLVGTTFHMTPVDAPTPAAREAFSLTLETHQLPLPAPATMVGMRGGSLFFEVQRRNITLSDTQLSPLEIEGHFDSNGKEKS